MIQRKNANPNDGQPADPANVGLAAKKIILKRMNVSDDDLESLTTSAEADELMKYLKEESKGQPNIPKKNMSNVPTPSDPNHRDNRQPAQDNGDEPYSAEELLDPLQVDVSRCNKETPECRILKIYDDESPEGRVF